MAFLALLMMEMMVGIVVKVDISMLWGMDALRMVTVSIFVL